MYSPVRKTGGALVLLCCILITGGQLFASLYPLNYGDASDFAVPISQMSRSPQPDTLLYDDGTVAFLDDTVGLWVDVRFTAPADFTLRAVYLLLFNYYNNSTDPCTLYVFDDSGGLPGTVLAGPYSFTVPNQTTWHQEDIDTLQFSAGQDFHIMYGPTVGGPPPPGSGPGWWAIFDASNTGNRTLTTTTWANYDTASGDAFIRAGGELLDPFIDLANNCTATTEQAHFPCNGETVTLTAQIENVGDTDVSTYTVDWMIVDDSTGTVVFSITASFGPIAVGDVLTVAATTSWTASSGKYTVSSDVDATGDAVASNDGSGLVLQVNTPLASEWFYYDDGGFESTFLAQSGDAWGTEYALCDASVRIDSISFSFGVLGVPDSVDVKILLNDGVGGAPNTELWGDRVLAADGWNTYFTGGVKVDSGSFTLAYYFASGISLDRDDNTPTAGINECMPNVTWFGTGSRTNWAQDQNGDWGMRVFSRPFYLMVDEVRPYRAATGAYPITPPMATIYNPAGVGVSMSGWRIGGEDGTFNYALPAWVLPANSYLEVVFDTAGTNDTDFSDRLGIYYTGIADSLKRNGELGLYNGSVSAANIVDFVTWGDTSPPLGDAYIHATGSGIWTAGEYVDITNYAIYSNVMRIPSGYDTDASTDWYQSVRSQVIPLWPDNPIQLIPSDGSAFDTLPDFAWRSHNDASEYLLEVDDDSLFGSPSISVVTNDTTYSSASIVEGNYFWRVVPNLTGVYTAALWDFSKVTFAVDLFGFTSVPQRFQHKDSRLLCIWDLSAFDGGNDHRRGCNKAAGVMGPWDNAHLQGAHIPNCNHCANYCTRASIQMINAKYGGTVRQDEVSYQIFNSYHAGVPEGDLGHGLGTLPAEERTALSWAINGSGVATSFITPAGAIPWATLMAEVNQGQPIMISIAQAGGINHTVVFHGYFNIGARQWVRVSDPWPNSSGWKRINRLPVARFHRITAAAPTGRAMSAMVTADPDGDGVMSFDEQNPRTFHCAAGNPDTDADEVRDKQEIMDYTFHGGRNPNGDHLGCPRIGIWPTIPFADIDGDGSRTEADCDSDDDSDFDGGEDINGDGRVPVGGLETCMFDNAALEIWIASLQIPGPVLCTEDVYLFGQTYHQFSWYPYELISPCPTPIDSTGLGWNGILISIANGIIPLQYIGTFGPGVYRVVVDVLRDHHYSAPDNWDPWLCFTVPPHLKLVIDVGDAAAVLPYYSDALSALNIEYDINTIPPYTPGPPWEYLVQYDMIIWVTGNQWQNTILPQDAYNLTEYLNRGGKLLITGQDIGYDIFQVSPPNDTTYAFYQNYLGAQFVQDDVGSQLVSGELTSFMGQFQELPITGPGGANYEDFFPDEVDALPHAQTVMLYDTSGGGTGFRAGSYSPTSRRGNFPGIDDPISSGGAGIATENLAANSRALYLPFAWEGIPDSTMRRDVMEAALNWLYGEYSAPAPVIPVISREENDIVLQWSHSYGAQSYNIYAHDEPNFTPDSTCFVGGVADSFFVDYNANELMEKRFYQVTAVGNVPGGHGRDQLRDWIADQTDIDVVKEELDRRNTRYIINHHSQTASEKRSSFNHHEATEPEYLKTGIR